MFTVAVRRTVTVGVVAVLIALPFAALFAIPGAALAAGTSTSSSAPATTSAVPTLNPTGANSPFSPGVPVSPTQAPNTTTAPAIANPTTTTSSSSNSGLSGSNALLIAIGAIVILAGISLFIWRDARRRAPVRHGAAALPAGAGGRSGSKARTKPRKLSPAERKRRKRGKAR